MFASITEDIFLRVAQLREDIQANLQAKGINASGRTSQSLQVIVTDTGGVKLVLTEGEHAPAKTLEIGREGGKVPYGFTSIIRQWSIDKGLQFANDRERNTFAYLTARKIAREGTQRHYLPEDVYSTLVKECVEDIKKIVTIHAIDAIKTNF